MESDVAELEQNLEGEVERYKKEEEERSMESDVAELEQNLEGEVERYKKEEEERSMKSDVAELEQNLKGEVEIHNKEEEERSMKSDVAELEQKLAWEVEVHNKEEEERRAYSWIELCDTNIWKFKDRNPALIRIFENELDASQWQDIAEDLGLSYAQIQRCSKCPDGYITRSLFNTLRDLPENQNLTLKRFLEILRNRERHDILRRLEKYAILGPEMCTTKTIAFTVQGQQEMLVQSSNIGTTEGFIANVLISHSHDTKKDAVRLAAQLRNPISSRKRLKVLLLQESDSSIVINSLQADPWNSIHKWFEKVDAVVPVLSPQFLRQIQNRDDDPTTGWEKRYNRYIYTMTLDQYVEEGCKNYSCRAVCPERYQVEVTNNALVQHSGILKSHWNCSSESDVEEFAKLLHIGAKWRRRLRKEQQQMAGVNRD